MGKQSRRNRLRPRQDPVVQQLPYQYILPGDLRKVKVVAYVSAMECAHHALMNEYMVTLDPALAYLAEDACTRVEQHVAQGKQGTNDPALFRQTFTDIFLQAYPPVLGAMRSGTYTVAPGLSETERLTLFEQYAAQRV